MGSDGKRQKQINCDHSRPEKKLEARWIGHVLRKEPGNITRTEGKRKRQSEEHLAPNSREGEMRTLNHMWGTIQKLAQNRKAWRTFVVVLHASRHSGP